MLGSDFHRIRLSVCVALFSWVSASHALGATAGNLFAVEVPVSERTAEAKDAALRVALGQVLIKVSGDRRIAAQSGAATMIQSAPGYVQQFRYTPNATLLVGFDGRKVQEDMRLAGLPIWSIDRPATLLWIALDDGQGERRVLSTDERGELRNEVERMAASRGVPLVWPLNDSIDRALVEPADIWGGFTENVLKASERYGAEGVLIGRLTRGADGAPYGTWELNIEGDQRDWRGTVSQSMNRLADFYADRLAVSAGGGPAQRMTITVGGLTGAKAYAEAVGELEKLSVVDQVQVVQVFGDQVMLELLLRGDQAQVARALSLSRVLTSDAENGGLLNYRYAR